MIDDGRVGICPNGKRIIQTRECAFGLGPSAL